ncbi:hypothetical protein ACFW9V_06705, partial [Streptomyces hygroscopicus]
MSETIDIVMTTIGSGSFLDHFADALAEEGARLVVIPDRKTPSTFYEACERARGRGGGGGGPAGGGGGARAGGGGRRHREPNP